MYCTNLLIVLDHHAAVKIDIDPEVSVLLHFTSFLVKIRLRHLVQAKFNLNSIYRHWVEMAVHMCFDSFKSIISISLQTELNVWFKYQYSHGSTFC